MGASRQNTLMYPSSAQALKVTSPIFCIPSLMRKRGNMLPPTADIARITIVEMPDNCARVRHSVASTSPNAAAAHAVKTVITAKPGRCETRGSRNTSAPQREHHRELRDAHHRQEQPLPCQHARHSGARADQSAERAALDFIEQRSARA